MLDSKQFIEDLNNKRDRAWHRLYKEFYPALCAYALKLTRGNSGVEDIVQECMIGLWDSELRFDNVRALAVWLYKTVYNRTLNLVRDENNARRLLGNYVRELDYTEEMAVELAIEESVIAKLRLALNELSKQQREIIDLSLQGRKVREIALFLEISENAVKMQKKRAYATLREQMGVLWLLL